MYNGGYYVIIIGEVYQSTATRELIVKGAEQPSGYTEPVLHRARARAKQAC